MSFFESGITRKRLQRGARKPFYRRAAHDGLGLSPAADMMSLLNITFFKKDLLIAVGRFDPRYFTQIFRTNLVEPLPEEYTGKVPGIRITGGQAGGTVRSRFRGKGEDAATCANGDRARCTLAAQGSARRGQSNALLG